MSFTKETKLEKPNEPDPVPKAPIIQHLGNGLILRWANPADAQRIADCAGDAFRETEEEEVATFHVESIYRMMRGNHPFSPDFAVIEDTRTSEFVACACLLSQEMEYAGVKFMIGRPDQVGTRFSYRGKGLAQALMNALHERSADKGHVMQILSGVPYFFRQFGYEYAMDFGASKKTYVASVPKASAYEPFYLKPASIIDVPKILEICDAHKDDALFYFYPSKTYFDYQIDGWLHEKANPEVDHTRDVLLVVDTKNVAKGFVMLSAKRGTTLNVLQLGYSKDLNLPVFSKCLIRLLVRYGNEMKSHDPDVPLPPLQQIGWWINGHHPIYEALGHGNVHETDHPFSFQVRIEDVPLFLKKIQSTLSKRLQGSLLFRNHSGLLKVGFFKDGFRMMFAHGHLTMVESWTPIHGVIEQPDASFPPEVFLQLLFGRRSISELRYILPDVSVRSESVEELLNTLFPKKNTYFAHFV